MTWEKLKEKLLDHIVTLVLSLVTFLCLVIWQAVPSETWARVWEAIPKQVLGALAGILLIALVSTAAYVYTLRRKLKQVQTPPGESQPFKPFPMFNVLWDEAMNPLCPVCQVFLSYSTRDVPDSLDDDPYYTRHHLVTCPKCKHEYELLDDHGYTISLTEARERLRQEYPHLPERRS